MQSRTLWGLVCWIVCSGAFTSTAAQEHRFDAVRGDRTSGWLPQTRSEVIARNGAVATSQPLAAAAGLEILQKGGNAFDAAVATAAVLNLVEPGSAGNTSKPWYRVVMGVCQVGCSRARSGGAWAALARLLALVGDLQIIRRGALRPDQHCDPPIRGPVYPESAVRVVLPDCRLDPAVATRARLPA